MKQLLLDLLNSKEYLQPLLDQPKVHPQKAHQLTDRIITEITRLSKEYNPETVQSFRINQALCKPHKYEIRNISAELFS